MTLSLDRIQKYYYILEGVITKKCIRLPIHGLQYREVNWSERRNERCHVVLATNSHEQAVT